MGCLDLQRQMLPSSTKHGLLMGCWFVKKTTQNKALECTDLQSSESCWVAAFTSQRQICPELHHQVWKPNRTSHELVYIDCVLPKCFDNI